MSAPGEPTILVTGVSGQVGFELVRSLQGLGRIVALDRGGLDLADPARIRAVVRELRPTIVVNPAAYTAVDDAESNCAAATALNVAGPRILAEEAERLRAVVVHYSTDYVFDGTKPAPYVEEDVPNPLNVYGSTKLAGELAIEQSGAAHLIFRTSWVYGLRGRNFLRTMQNLAAERSRLSIVADQVGAPTWARTIADITAHVIAAGLTAVRDDGEWWRERSGVYHLCSGGTTSWCDFARAIFQYGSSMPEVVPISSEGYPTRARRPKNSQMSTDKLTRTFGLRPPQWQEALHLCIGQG